MIRNTLQAMHSSPLLLTVLVITAAVAWLNPALVLATVWLLTQLGIAACLGYWLDRTLFHYAKPRLMFFAADHMSDIGNVSGSRSMRWQAALAALRCALIMAAVIIALGYALILVPSPGV